MEFNLKKVLKALLFSTSEPLSIKDIQRVFTRFHEQAEDLLNFQEEESTPEAGSEAAEGNSTEVSTAEVSVHSEQAESMQFIASQIPSLLTATQIREAMDEVSRELAEQGEVFQVQSGPNGYKIVVIPQYGEWVRLLRDDPKPSRLRSSALETLAIIAYRQPVTRAEMEAVRGVSVDNAINKLIELELITVMGRADLPGRPIQYGTTDKFLEFCGIQSLSELPASDVVTPQQLNEWIAHATGQKEGLKDQDVGLPSSDSQETQSILSDTYVQPTEDIEHSDEATLN